jgi:hypothetical protein
MDTNTTAVVTIPGSVSVPGDAELLRVRLVVSNGRVTLRSGEAELGSWSLTSVEIVPTGDGAFGFTADGETITFLPDEPDAFSQLAIITTHTTKGRRRRKVEKSTTTSKAGNPAKAVRPVEAGTAGTAAVPPPAASPPPARRSRTSPPPSANRVMPSKAGRDRGKAVARGAQHVAAGATRRAWLFALDQARDKNLFGLDRVQVTDDMRAGAHEHTWDHRIANGIAKHICTACGKVRLRAD